MNLLRHGYRLESYLTEGESVLGADFMTIESIVGGMVSKLLLSNGRYNILVFVFLGFFIVSSCPSIHKEILSLKHLVCYFLVGQVPAVQDSLNHGLVLSALRYGIL